MTNINCVSSKVFMVLGILFNFLLPYVGSVAFAQDSLSQQDSWSQKTLLGQVESYNWTKNWLEVPTAVGVESVSIKSSALVGVEDMTTAQVLSWGKDFLLEPKAASSRQAMKMVCLSGLSSDIIARLVKKVKEGSKDPKVAFVYSVQPISASLKPMIPNALNKNPYVAVPIKWTKETTSMMDALVKADRTDDSKTQKGLAYIAQQLAAKSVLPELTRPNPKAAMYAEILKAIQSEQMNEVYFAMSAGYVNVNSDETSSGCTRNVLTSGVAWPESDHRN